MTKVQRFFQVQVSFKDLYKNFGSKVDIKSKIFLDMVGLSLFSFALGVEFAQTVIVIGVLCLSFLVLKTPKLTKSIWNIAIGSFIFILALGMIFERI